MLPNSGHSFTVAVQTPSFTGSKDPGQLGEGYGTCQAGRRAHLLGFSGNTSKVWYPPGHPPNMQDKAWLVLGGELGKGAIPTLRSSDLLHPSVKLQRKETPQIHQAPCTDKVVLLKTLI